MKGDITDDYHGLFPEKRIQKFVCSRCGERADSADEFDGCRDFDCPCHPLNRQGEAINQHK